MQRSPRFSNEIRKTLLLIYLRRSSSNTQSSHQPRLKYQKKKKKIHNKKNFQSILNSIHRKAKRRLSDDTSSLFFFFFLNLKLVSHDRNDARQRTTRRRSENRDSSIRVCACTRYRVRYSREKGRCERGSPRLRYPTSRAAPVKSPLSRGGPRDRPVPSWPITLRGVDTRRDYEAGRLASNFALQIPAARYGELMERRKTAPPPINWKDVAILSRRRRDARVTSHNVCKLRKRDRL